jgi:tRNA-dihydrouridine synthase 1
LGRKYGAELCYTPMFHSRLFSENPQYRALQFTTNQYDRPLIVQFCGDNPETMLKAAKFVEDQCDAVDVNLGCPQNIAKKGHYGSYLQDEWELIESIVKTLHEGLKVPVTCKIRVFPDVEKTVKYAKMIEAAGAQLLTVHGRLREQKGHNTGLADWSQIKKVVEAVKIPVIANGNILSLGDCDRCIKETGAVGVMSAEAHLYNPALFSDKIVPVWEMVREYLEIAKDHPAPISFVRGHLFKLFRKCLDTFTEHRSKLGGAKTLAELEEISQDLCQKLKEKYEELSEEERENILNSTVQERIHNDIFHSTAYIRPDYAVNIKKHPSEAANETECTGESECKRIKIEEEQKYY